MEFYLDKNHIQSFCNKGGNIKMKHQIQKWGEEYLIEFYELNMIQKPSDWYNLVKYKDILPFYSKIKKERIYGKLLPLEENIYKATLKIGNEIHLPPFLISHVEKELEN